MAAAASSSNRRLALLVLVALGLWYFRDSFTTDAPPARKPARAATAANPGRALRTAPPDDVCTVPTSLPQRDVLVARARANPFVEPPPPPVKPAKPVKVQPVVVTVVAPPVAPPASAPLPPPKLPYTYIGQFVDPGRPTTVFLNVGNALINANPGDTLDGGFRLESIGPRELVFVHVQRNVTLRMPIEGERL